MFYKISRLIGATQCRGALLFYAFPDSQINTTEYCFEETDKTCLFLSESIWITPNRSNDSNADPLAPCRIWFFLEPRMTTLDDPVRSCSVESALLRLDNVDDDAAVCVVTGESAAPQVPIQLTHRFKELQVSTQTQWCKFLGQELRETLRRSGGNRAVSGIKKRGFTHFLPQKFTLLSSRLSRVCSQKKSLAIFPSNSLRNDR